MGLLFGRRGRKTRDTGFDREDALFPEDEDSEFEELLLLDVIGFFDDDEEDDDE